MEETQKRSALVLNNFILKIIGLALMTLDHVAYLLVAFGAFEKDSLFTIITRGFGRMALPIFCFLIVEGVLKTRSFKKYALRLGICASAVSLAILGVEYLPWFGALTLRTEGIIFLDLLLGALAVFCLRDKRWYIKLISVVILGYGVASVFANGLECVSCNKEVWFVPFFMRTQYGFGGVLLITLIYLFRVFSDAYMLRFNGAYENTPTEQLVKNLSALLGILVATLIIFVFQKYSYDWFGIIVNETPQIQALSAFACVFILFYNGQRGYNAKWFKYGCYLYYAMHSIILYLIFMIIFH